MMTGSFDEQIKVLEFYSGIGGMHYALKKSGIKFKVTGAFDINTNANAVYRHNFPDVKLMQKNLEGLTVKELDKLSAQCWTMSPPCQPYTRQGKQEASKDSRAKSFLHLLDLLVEMTNPPAYILIENVKGFDASDTRDRLLHVLQLMDYQTKEFLVSPVELGIPNSRLRYYLLAKRSPKSFQPHILDRPFSVVETRNHIGDYLNAIDIKTGTCGNLYLVPDSVLMRFSSIMDIVSSDSTGSCCFTKAYGKYVEGTGSIYSPLSRNDIDEVFKKIKDLATALETAATVETTPLTKTTQPSSSTTATTTASNDNDGHINETKLVLLRSLGLRYFSPAEISKLLCFPEDFDFPEEMTVRQRYQLLGNSVSVCTIAHLMSAFLFSNE